MDGKPELDEDGALHAGEQFRAHRRSRRRRPLPGAVGLARWAPARLAVRAEGELQTADREIKVGKTTRYACGSRRPTGRVDLIEARDDSRSGKQAILFLMFNPGPKDTVLNDIVENRPGRQRRAAACISVAPQSGSEHRQESCANCSTSRTPTRRTSTWCCRRPSMRRPSFRQKELKKLPGTFAMVHSKVVLVDPFSTTRSC